MSAFTKHKNSYKPKSRRRRSSNTRTYKYSSHEPNESVRRISLRNEIESKGFEKVFQKLYAIAHDDQLSYNNIASDIQWLQRHYK